MPGGGGGAFRHAHPAVVLSLPATADRHASIHLSRHGEERRNEREAEDSQQQNGEQLAH